LESGLPEGVSGFEDEEFAIDINGAASERLAFLKRKASGDLALSRPPRKEFLSEAVPIVIGRLGLRADAVTGRVDGHIGDDLSDESGIAVQVA